MLKVLEINNEYFLYDGRTNRFHKINAKIKNDLEKKKIKQNSYDIKKIENVFGWNIFSDFEFEISMPYSIEQLDWICKNITTQLVLSITEKCNMNCHYCGYHYKREKWNKIFLDMELSTAYKAIDELFNRSLINDTIFISFYGGEPLLRRDFIDKCIEYAKNKNVLHKKVLFTMPTNGTLFNDDTCQFLIKNNILLTISLDGPRSIHDRYRIFNDNSPTYDVVIENLKKLYYLDKNYFLDCVIFLPVHTPPYFDDIVYEYFENLPCLNQFSSLSITPYFKKYLSNMDFSQQKILTFEETQKFRKQHQAMETIINKFENTSIIPTNVMKAFPAGCCIPLNKKLYVHANGNYYICEKVDEDDDSNIIGNVTMGINISKLFNQYRKLEDVFIKNKCGTCWAIHFCTACFRDYKSINKEKCTQIKRTLEYEMKLYIKEKFNIK